MGFTDKLRGLVPKAAKPVSAGDFPNPDFDGMKQRGDVAEILIYVDPTWQPSGIPEDQPGVAAEVGLRIRALAANALGDVGDPVAVEPLLELVRSLAQTETTVRQTSAIDGGGPGTFTALMLAMISSARGAAMGALNRLRPAVTDSQLLDRINAVTRGPG